MTEEIATFRIPLVKAGSPFRSPGLRIPGRSATEVTLSPEGVTVWRSGRRVLWLGEEQLHIYLWGSREAGNAQFCLCPHSLNELAELRETELQNSPLSARELPRRKEDPNWQMNFAREYLYPLLIGNVHEAARQSFIRLPGDEELVSVLKQCFPEKVALPISQIRPEQTGETTQKLKKKNAMAHRDSTRVNIALVTAMAVFSLVLFLGDLGNKLLLFLIAGVVAVLLGWLLYPGVYGYMPALEGIRLLRGKKKSLIPAESIKTMAKFRVKVGTEVTQVLMFSDLTAEEAATRYRKALRCRLTGKTLLGMYSRLPDGEQLCALRYYSGRIHCFGSRGRRWLAVEYQPGQEKQLRELYPKAQWLESPEGIF